jgi:hypothetical protein
MNPPRPKLRPETIQGLTAEKPPREHRMLKTHRPNHRPAMKMNR